MKKRSKKKEKKDLKIVIKLTLFVLFLIGSLIVIFFQTKIEVENPKNLYSNLDAESVRLLRFLKRQNSPIAEKKYVDIIISVSKENGADYRLNVGIMGAESDLCKVPIKKYNCYGYMNNVYYESFEDALTDLTGKVSRQYTSRYGWNLTAMGKAYGAHNVEVWEKNVRGTTNKI